MPGNCRVGDIGSGICPCHLSPVSYITTFITGADSIITNGKIQTVIGTIGAATCGHPTVAIGGSSNVTAENKGIHRLGDNGSNCGPYISITGSEDVITNG